MTHKHSLFPYFRTQASLSSQQGSYPTLPCSAPTMAPEGPMSLWLDPWLLPVHQTTSHPPPDTLSSHRALLDVTQIISHTHSNHIRGGERETEGDK